jgi:Phosphoribosylaminoimidazole carboxylase C-terminal domain
LAIKYEYKKNNCSCVRPYQPPSWPPVKRAQRYRWHRNRGSVAVKTSSSPVQVIRAILGWPLGSVDLLPACALMYNVLGAADGAAGVAAAQQTMARAYRTPGAAVHWYDKAGCARKRKLGHINIVADSRAEACRRLDSVAPGARMSGPHRSIVLYLSLSDHRDAFIWLQGSRSAPIRTDLT